MINCMKILIKSFFTYGATATYAASSEQNGSARYDYEYSEGELKEFIPVVHVASEEGRKVQVYFNNHPKGNGARNAMMLKIPLSTSVIFGKGWSLLQMAGRDHKVCVNLQGKAFLRLYDLEILDSVVVHELCHRRHMNHSKEFYSEIYRVFPDYDRCNKWLKENGGVYMKRIVK